MKIAIIINGSIRKLKKTKQRVEDGFAKFDHKVFVSDSRNHFITLCTDALIDGFNYLIFTGGDGTLNLGINAIISHYKFDTPQSGQDYNWDKISQIRIGVYAAGSGNDFIKSVNLDESLETLLQRIESESWKRIDIGELTCQLDNSLRTEHVSFFVNITDVGIGGEVLQAKSAMPKWLNGKMTYFLAILKTFFSYRKRRLLLESHDFRWEGKVLNLIIANAKYFGNSLGIAPDANVSDGQFSLVIIGDVSLFDYLKNLKNLKNCVKLVHPQISYHKITEAQITMLDDREAIIDMDGELVGVTPMRVRCLPGKISFIC